MKKDTEKTVVVFRKFKKGGDILALFPNDLFNWRGGVMSYQCVRQHGEADYHMCIDMSKPAKPAEYKALKLELESLGYNLDIKLKRRYS